MIRSYRPILLALLLLFAVHLRPGYRVSVAGERLAGRYSRAQIRTACEAAAQAAEELTPGEAALPRLRVSLRLGLRRPGGETAALTDALLRAAGGITKADAVRVNGDTLGTVKDGASLLQDLRETIRSGMPAGAIVGNLSGRLQIRPVYTREGLSHENADMLASILAAAPVFYVDSRGKLV